jgi:hypothetical protein
MVEGKFKYTEQRQIMAVNYQIFQSAKGSTELCLSLNPSKCATKLFLRMSKLKLEAMIDFVSLRTSGMEIFIGIFSLQDRCMIGRWKWSLCSLSYCILKE